MKEATVLIHHRSSDNFARVPHETIEDPRLSWNAKGVLTYLLSKPPGWKTRVSDIRNKGKDGERAIRSGLKELRACGYINLVPIREGGRMVEWQWQVADIPMFSPDGRNAHVENAHVQNAYLSKNEFSKKDSSNNETKETKETSPAPQADAHGNFPSYWKPDRRTKDQKLASIRQRDDYPSEVEFNEFLSDEGLDWVGTHRTDLYGDLCESKWHHWRPTAKKWVPIKNWKEYVRALNDKMEDDVKGIAA